MHFPSRPRSLLRSTALPQPVPQRSPSSRPRFSTIPAGRPTALRIPNLSRALAEALPARRLLRSVLKVRDCGSPLRQATEKIFFFHRLIGFFLTTLRATAFFRNCLLCNRLLWDCFLCAGCLGAHSLALNHDLCFRDGLLCLSTEFLSSGFVLPLLTFANPAAEIGAQLAHLPAVRFPVPVKPAGEYKCQ